MLACNAIFVGKLLHFDLQFSLDAFTQITFCGSFQIVLVKPICPFVVTIVSLFRVLVFGHDVFLIGSMVFFIVQDLADLFDFERSPFCRSVGERKPFRRGCLFRGLRTNLVVRIRNITSKVRVCLISLPGLSLDPDTGIVWHFF